ncbi:hemerythrin domain-containing protein [Streptomyces sp. NPDC057257]|uniref:hemerythrin domain-containing protein n=1 Tax=Streptomyces sp. NPDC057257 TaxID=3346071 RepID=UPI00363C6970
MDEQRGIIEELTADHRRIQRLVDRIRSTASDGEERTALVEQVSMALVRHSVAEKRHLYPVVRRFVTGGEGWADRDLAEERLTEQALEALEFGEPGSEEYGGLLLSVVTRATDHVVRQEQLLFPRLQSMCPADTLRDLGPEVRPTEAAAPTRPRPPAPQSPPLVKLTSRMWGPLDRLRDILTRRGRR